MKTPPGLLGAALLFWGWETGNLPAAAALALLLESARWVRVRWDFSDEDFSRIWILCTLLVLGSAVYSFTTNGGPESIGSLLADPNFRNQAGVGRTSARTAVTLLRCLPLTLFPFVLAQAYSTRDGVSLTMISLLLRRRWLRARRLGRPQPALRRTNLAYPYFGTCLFSAGAHGGGGDPLFFFGTGLLLAWGLWAGRSLRFALGTWLATVGVALAAGYGAQMGVIHFEKLLENYNPQWLTAAAHRGSDPQKSQTDIGAVARGKNSGRIVVRLETPPHVPPPSYLREATYRRYKSPIWYSGTPPEAFESIAAEADGTTWLLPPRVNKPLNVRLACYLADKGSVLPLPTGTARLESLAAYTLQVNPEGAVFALGPGLVLFNAVYGPGATLDATNTVDDLEVPPREVEGLETFLAQAGLQGANPNQPEAIQRRLAEYFQNHFTYQLGGLAPAPKGSKTNETALARFLLNTRRGHCEYFATAAVLALRQLHIPARYAVGFYVHEGAGTKYVARQRDGHAWCLVWNAREKLWHDFDPTPASWVTDESQSGSWWQWLGDTWSRLWFEFSKLRWGQTNLQVYLLWLIVPVLVVLVVQILFRGGRRRQKAAAAGTVTAPDWPGRDSEFYVLADRLAALGLPRQTGETVVTWLRRAAGDPKFAALTAPLQTLTALHYRHRFDPRGLPTEERQQLATAARACLAQLPRAQ